MDGLDPAVLGWQEFWLRIAVIFFTLFVFLFTVAVLVRLALDIKNGVRWAIRKARDR